jgi:hypothetical protein
LSVGLLLEGARIITSYAVRILRASPMLLSGVKEVGDGFVSRASRHRPAQPAAPGSLLQ